MWIDMNSQTKNDVNLIHVRKGMSDSRFLREEKMI